MQILIFPLIFAFLGETFYHPRPMKSDHDGLFEPQNLKNTLLHCVVITIATSMYFCNAEFSISCYYVLHLWLCQDGRGRVSWRVSGE